LWEREIKAQPFSVRKQLEMRACPSEELIIPIECQTGLIHSFLRFGLKKHNNCTQNKTILLFHNQKENPK
jgi:hypothetical protein